MALAVAALTASFSAPRLTATAATAFISLIASMGKKRIKVDYLAYTAGAASHTLTFMFPIGKTTVAATAAAAATSVLVARDAGNFSVNAVADGTPAGNAANVSMGTGASGMFVAFKLANGNWHQTTLSANGTVNANGTVTLPITDALPSQIGLGVGAICHWYGTTTSVNPNTGKAHPQLIAPASATTSWTDTPVMVSPRPDDTLLIYSPNGGAAGILERAGGHYSPL